MQGLSLTDRFDAYFVHNQVSGFTPKLVDPSDSTGGGKQAVQHVVLEPADSRAPVLTAGWVNCATSQAKLRTLACMQHILSRRSTGQSVALNAMAYQQFFEGAWKFLQENGMQLAAEHEPPDAVAPAKTQSSGTHGWVWGLLVLIVFAAAVAALFLFRDRLPFLHR